jgi:hypothetical protein
VRLWEEDVKSRKDEKFERNGAKDWGNSQIGTGGAGSRGRKIILGGKRRLCLTVLKEVVYCAA